MERNINEYLKYYIPCNIINPKDGRKYTLANITNTDKLFIIGNNLACTVSDVNPILRRLSSITEEEKLSWYEQKYSNSTLSTRVKIQIIDYILNSVPLTFDSDSFHWLISNEFWLFGDQYFNEGLIYEKY